MNASWAFVKKLFCFVTLCDYDNLIVVRAFTKLFAIPGVRLGYMLSKNEAVRQKVQRNLPEWNVSVLAQMAGEALRLWNSEYIKENGIVL